RAPRSWCCASHLFEEVVGGLARRLTDDGVLEIGVAHVDPARTQWRTGGEELRSPSLRLPFARCHGQDLTGLDIDDPGIESNGGLGFFLSNPADLDRP